MAINVNALGKRRNAPGNRVFPEEFAGLRARGASGRRKARICTPCREWRKTTSTRFPGLFCDLWVSTMAPRLSNGTTVLTDVVNSLGEGMVLPSDGKCVFRGKTGGLQRGIGNRTDKEARIGRVTAVAAQNREYGQLAS